MKLKDLVYLNQYDDDKILLVNSYTKDIIKETTMLNEKLKEYYENEIVYIGVSNDLGTNLLVFIEI